MNRHCYFALAACLFLTLTSTPANAFLGGFLKKSKDKKVLSGEQMSSQEAKASAILKKAQASEQAGKQRRARDLYRSIVKSYPRTTSAEEALFRSAQIRESEGDSKRAFEEYENLMTNYRNSSHFSEALTRQFAIAEALRKDGRKGFMGMGAAVQPSKLIEMFEHISKSAPRTEYAPRSLVSIGHIQAKQGAVLPAIAAYQRVVDGYAGTASATEAQYEIFKLRGVKATDSNSPVEDRAQVEAGLDFMNQNPADTRTQEVKGKLDDIEERAAEKNYNTGRAYEKRGKFTAARVYYRDLVKIPNSQWAAKAQQRLNEMDAAPAENTGETDKKLKFPGILPGKKKKLEMRTSGDEVVPIPAAEGSGSSN